MTTKNLNKLWGKEQILLSLGQVKGILKAMKKVGLKEDSDLLIFADSHFNMFRRVGEQTLSERVSGVIGEKA